MSSALTYRSSFFLRSEVARFVVCSLLSVDAHALFVLGHIGVVAGRIVELHAL